MRRIGILMAGLMVAAVVGGCGDGDKAGTVAGPQEKGASESSGLVAEFALEDVNPSSPFYGTKVSPRLFLQQVSAWYFGHST